MGPRERLPFLDLLIGTSWGGPVWVPTAVDGVAAIAIKSTQWHFLAFHSGLWLFDTFPEPYGWWEVLFGATGLALDRAGKSWLQVAKKQQD